MTRTSPEIAIVDDDPSVLKALARLLSTRSLTVRTFLSAPNFLASLGEWQPRCLIADLQMPEMTGLKLQQQLNQRAIDIPTIIITAQDESGLREQCELAGAVAYLTKPIQDTLLFAAIEAACMPS